MREIAEAEVALPPEQAAGVIYRALFENGPQRLSAVNKAVATGVIAVGLIEWRKQILRAQGDEAAKWKKKFTDTKAELDDVKLRYALLQKEQ